MEDKKTFYTKKELIFNYIKNNNKTIIDNVKYKGLILYYQHLDDYKNTYNLICKGFDKIEKEGNLL